MNEYAKYSAIAIQTVAIMLLGVWGGVKVDKALNCSPLFSILLSVIALFLALYSMIKKIKK